MRHGMSADAPACRHELPDLLPRHVLGHWGLVQRPFVGRVVGPRVDEQIGRKAEAIKDLKHFVAKRTDWVIEVDHYGSSR